MIQKRSLSSKPLPYIHFSPTALNRQTHKRLKLSPPSFFSLLYALTYFPPLTPPPLLLPIPSPPVIPCDHAMVRLLVENLRTQTLEGDPAQPGDFYLVRFTPALSADMSRQETENVALVFNF